MKYVAAMFSIALFVVQTSGASALGVGLGTDASVRANVGSNSVGVGAEATTTATTSHNPAASGNGADVEAEIGTNALVQGGVLRMTRAEISARSESATSVRVDAPSSVQTEADLAAYATALLRSDENVGGVEASQEAVSLWYKARARLFGFIPIFVQAKGTVRTGGEASVDYPWYAFLATKNEALLRSDVEAAAQVAASARTEFDAATQANLIQALHVAMRSNLQAELAAEGAVRAATQ